MNVLLISSSSGSRGGGEIYLARLAEGLVGLGHRVGVLMSTAPVMDELAAAIEPYGTVHRLPLRNTYDRRSRGLGAVADHDQQRRVAQFIGALAPDVVHVNQQVAEDGLDLVLAAERARVPYLTTIHVTHAAQSLGAKFGVVRDLVTWQLFARIKARHVVVADQARRDLAAWLGSDIAKRLHVVHNGVRPVIDGQAVAARSAVRSEWGVAHDQVVLGCVGRIEEQENPLFAFAIAAAAKADNIPVKLVWIGDGALRRTMEEHAASQDASALLHIDGWRNDVARRLPAFDIFLIPSKFEGLPLALLEGMWAGLPAIVSDVDAMPEAINDGVNGFVCPPDDLPRWREAVSRLAADPALRHRMGFAAAAVARERFGLGVMAAKTLDLYRAAVGGSVREKSAVA